jgi:hypothetical protein
MTGISSKLTDLTFWDVSFADIHTELFAEERESLFLYLCVTYNLSPLPPKGKARPNKCQHCAAHILMLTPHIFIVAMEENLQEKVCKKKKRMQDYNHWVQRGVFKGVCIKGCVKRVCVQKGVSSKMCV